MNFQYSISKLKSLLLATILVLLTTTCVYAENTGEIGTFGYYPYEKEYFSIETEGSDGWTHIEYDTELKKLIESKYENGEFDSNNYLTYGGKTYYAKPLESGGANFYKCLPIEWKVLADEGDTLLLITSKIIHSGPYISVDEMEGRTSWENSTARKYLNNEFIKNSFPSSAENDIVESNIDNSESPDEVYSDKSGHIGEDPSTVDKIFLPSLSEMKNTSYGFGEKESRITSSIADKENKAIRYYTRTIGQRGVVGNPEYTYPIYVDKDGGLYHSVSSIFNPGQPGTWDAGYRPMMRIKKDSPFWNGNGDNSSDVEIKPGDGTNELNCLLFSKLVNDDSLKEGDTYNDFIKTTQSKEAIKNITFKNNPGFADGELNYAYLYEKYLQDWKVVKVYPASKNQGMKAVAFENKDGDIIFAYKDRNLKDLKSLSNSADEIALHIFNLESQMFDPAYTCLNDCITEMNLALRDVTVTGTGLGGGLAMMVSAQTGCRGEVFGATNIIDLAYYWNYESMGRNYQGRNSWNFTNHSATVFTDQITKFAPYWQSPNFVKTANHTCNGLNLDFSSLDRIVNIDIPSNILQEDSNGKFDLSTFQYDSKSDYNETKSLNPVSWIPKAFTKYLPVDIDELGVGMDLDICKLKLGISLPTKRGTATFGTESDDTLTTPNLTIDASFGPIDSSVDFLPNMIPHTDIMYGGNGKDHLIGSYGNDYLIGGKGNDNLNGGTGNDTYLYYKKDDDNVDVIEDCSGHDKLIIYGYPENSKIKISYDTDYAFIAIDNDHIVEIKTKGRLVELGNFEIVNNTTKETVTLDYGKGWIGKVSDLISGIVSCPVSVDILDSNGNIVISLEDKKPQAITNEYGNFYVFEDRNGEYTKYFELTDPSCSYQIRGTDNGSMNIQISRTKGDGTTEFLNKNEIPVSANSVFDGKFDFNDPNLNGNGQKIELNKTSYIPMSNLSISEDNLNLEIGQTHKLSYSYSPENSSDHNFSWSSEDPTVAKVDNEGNVTALSEGIVRISVSNEQGQYKDCLIVVGSGDETVSNSVPIYRLYNASSGEHLFTSDLNEYNTLPSVGWTQEGIGWNSPASGDPVYRLYSPVTGAHLYTKDENEVNTLLSNGNWQADNDRKPIMYSGGSKSVYRLYHEGIRMHLLTTDENEYNVLSGSGWNQEGVALNSIS